MSVRAIVIDDSVVVRRMLATVLAETGDVEVVATASDGRLGLQRIAALRPSVVTLDVEMPGMSGIETLTEIRRQWPDLPVIMYSTLTERGAVTTLDALALGAVDYATKPTGATDRTQAAQQIRTGLLPLVRLWSNRGVRAEQPRRSAPAPVTVLPVVERRHSVPVELVVIGVSTGGPEALATVVPSLAAELPVPVLVVQHMPVRFTAMLAQRLDTRSSITVSEAVDGETLESGHVYIAPGGRHTEVVGGRRIRLTDADPENFCRPAVDVLFRSVAAASTLAVVLTGMGQDGMLGAEAITRAGGTVVAQDEQTSVVWGMPGAVVRANLATGVHPVDQIAGVINTAVRGRISTGGAA